jgi:hypothetical protein
MTRSTRRLAGAAAAAVLLTACSGTAAAPSAPPHLLDRQQILAEYTQETSRLALPDGARWDGRPVELDVPAGDPAHLWEAGVGAQTAQFHWYCSWARAALADDSGRGPALAQLATFPDLGVWQAMDETGHAMFQAILDDARAGVLDSLDGYVADNCQQVG